MKKLIFLSFISFISFAAQAQITFHKTYDGRVSPGSSVQQTTDGGYIIGGNYFPGFGGYLIKTDAYGDTLWTKTYNSWIWSHAVLQTTDGGYVLFGSCSPGISGGQDVALLKTDSFGNLLWSKSYGDIYDNFSTIIQQTSDGGYVISGLTDTDTSGFGNSIRSIFLIKTDSIGDTLWTKTYSGNFTFCQSMQQTSDGGFIVSGYGFASSAFLLKTDDIGIPQWSKTYGGSTAEEAMCVKQLPDGGFIFAGEAHFGNSGDVYLVRTDGNGDLLWSKILGDSTLQRSYSIVPTNDNGYMITGYTAGIMPTYIQDIFLLHTDSIGNFVWAKKIINSPNDDMGVCIQQTTDGGYVISAWTHYSVPEKINLIKIDSLGNIGCSFINTFANSSTPNTIVTNVSIQIVPWNLITGIPVWQMGSGGTVATICSSVNVNENEKAEFAFNIFPNPSYGTFSINISPSSKYFMIEIFNVIGEKIYSEKRKNEAKKEIHLDNISSGIYFVKVFDGDKYYCKKIIIERD